MPGAPILSIARNLRKHLRIAEHRRTLAGHNYSRINYLHRGTGWPRVRNTVARCTLPDPHNPSMARDDAGRS